MKREGGQECLCVLLFRRVAGIIHHSPLLPASCLEADSANRVKGLPSPLASCFLAFWLLLGCGCWEAHLGDWRAEDSEVSISHPSSKGLSSAGGFSMGLGLGPHLSSLLPSRGGNCGWSRGLSSLWLPCAFTNSPCPLNTIFCIVCVCACDVRVIISVCSCSCV